MKKTIEELFDAPYWIIDILPKQVPKDSPGQYFAVERYWRDPERFARIKQKHIDLILRLNCYRSISLDETGTLDPPPGEIEGAMRTRTLTIRVGDAMILSEADDTHMTVFAPDEELLSLLRVIAAGEGLFVWQPPEGGQ